MRDVLGPNTVLGYCTNVHAGADLARMMANLRQHALAVKRRISPASPMGVGLWMSAQAAREILARKQVGRLRDELLGWGLIPFTFNGFPYGDFHEPVVKHRVYEPDWAHSDRLGYSLNLAVILAELLETDPGAARTHPRNASDSGAQSGRGHSGAHSGVNSGVHSGVHSGGGGGGEGGISTLPIGWPGAPCRPVDLAAAAHNLRHWAREAARIEAETGILIHLDLEPEPGCILQRAADVIRFFHEYLLPGLSGGDEALVRRHIRICHDICHAAVMFESSQAVFSAYATAGIGVGKVQISSAVAVDFSTLPPEQRVAAVQALHQFNEPRYLHQTTVRRPDGTLLEYADLSAALAAQPPQGQWRIHFHVPLFLGRLGGLATTQAEIRPCLAAARASGVPHFEVETYAWSVLPAELRPADLSAGIARELQWVVNPPPPGDQCR